VNEEVKIKKALDSESDTHNIPFPQLAAAIIFFMPMTIFDELSETAVESEHETSPTAPIDTRHEA